MKKMKKKILVVDDDPHIRSLIKEIISAFFGKEVIVVMGINGEDGLRELKENNLRPDLVITDLEMECRDSGLWLAEKIKEISSDIPVIMISGANPSKEIQEVVDYFFSKPLSVASFVAKIRDLLNSQTKE